MSMCWLGPTGRSRPTIHVEVCEVVNKRNGQLVEDNPCSHLVVYTLGLGRACTNQILFRHCEAFVRIPCYRLPLITYFSKHNRILTY